MYKEQEWSQIQKWVEGQKLRALQMKEEPPFYRNLEAALDEKRACHSLVTLHRFEQQVDFSSNDFLSLATSGLLRDAFLKELECNPNFDIGSTGSRISDGNNSYIESLEEFIAKFHHAPGALVLNSGYDANCAIFSALPRPGDAIVFDELIHASCHDGMKSSLASNQIPFKHNCADSLLDTLESLKEAQPLIKQGKRCVLVAIEAVYSMDGDVAPLAEIVDAIKEAFPGGNAQLVVDEAHSTGLVGEDGRGLVSALGLEKEVAVRLHTYGKGLGTTGAAILANSTVINTLLNFARPLIYTTAPSFPMLAAIRGGYNLMESGETRILQNKVQCLVKHFCGIMKADQYWDAAVNAGICSIPVSEDIESRTFVTQFLPVWTRPGENYFLTMHLHGDGFTATPIDPPVVPRGTSRVRIVIHAANTEAEIEGLAASICSWAKEMLEIQEGKGSGNGIPKAMREVYRLAKAAKVQDLDPSKMAINTFE